MLAEQRGTNAKFFSQQSHKQINDFPDFLCHLLNGWNRIINCLFLKSIFSRFMKVVSSFRGLMTVP